MKPSKSYLISFEKYAHNHLINEYKKSIHIEYNSLIINNLLCNGKCHLVSLFKDYLILDETADFFVRFYPKNKAISKLKQLFNYYEESSFIFPNYIPLKEAKYIYRNIMKKQRVIDEQENLDEIKEKKKKKSKNKISLNNLYSQDSFNDKFFNSSIYNSICNGNQSLLRIIFGIDKNIKNQKEKEEEKDKKKINEDEVIEKYSIDSEFLYLNDESFIKNSNLYKNDYDSDISEIKDIVKNIKKNENKVMKNNLVENESYKNKLKIKFDAPVNYNVNSVNKINMFKENFQNYFQTNYGDNSANFRNKSSNANYFSINSSDSNIIGTKNFTKGFNNINNINNLSNNKRTYYLSNKNQKIALSTNNSSRKNNVNANKNRFPNKYSKEKHKKINSTYLNINPNELKSMLSKINLNDNINGNKQIQINNNIYINEINLFNKANKNMNSKVKIINNNFPKIINKLDIPKIENFNNKIKNALDVPPLSCRNTSNVIRINEITNKIKNKSVNKKEKIMDKKLSVHGLQVSRIEQTYFKHKFKKNSDNFDYNFANKDKDINMFNKKNKSTNKNKVKYNLTIKLGLGQNYPSIKINRKNGYLTERQINTMKLK